jgi:hypothetical protein
LKRKTNIDDLNRQARNEVDALFKGRSALCNTEYPGGHTITAVTDERLRVQFRFEFDAVVGSKLELLYSA